MLASLLLALVTPIPADSVADTHDLEQVVVTATHTPKMLKEVPVLTRVLRARDIQRLDVTNVEDLLQQEVPGLEFTYSMAQQQSLNFSGFGGSSVLFLIDGERLAGEALDNVDYARLSMQEVERVEIIKGGASALYGSNAVGGVVNVITREKKDPWAVNLNLRGGSHGAWRTGVSASFNKGNWNSLTTWQRDQTGAIQLSKNDDIQQLYAYHSDNIRERLIFRPFDGMKLTGRLGYFYRQRRPLDVSRERYRDVTAGLAADWQISENDILKLRYSFDQYDKSDYYSAQGYDIRDYSNVQHNVSILYNRTFDGRNHLIVGGDWIRDYLMTYQFSGDHRLQHKMDVFTQIDYSPLDRLSVVGAMRWDWYSLGEGSRVSGKLSLMYRGDQWSLRAGYAGGFRAPTLKERYMRFNPIQDFTIYGNEGLKAEVSHNFSITGESYGTVGDWMRWNASVSGCLNFVNNRITTAWYDVLYVDDALTHGMKYLNIGQVRILGIDVNGEAQFSHGLSLKASYNINHEHTPAGMATVAATRPQSFTGRIGWDHRFSSRYAFQWTLSCRALSSVTTDQFTMFNYTDITAGQAAETTYPGYALWKIIFTQDIFKGIRLSAAVDNLFNYRPSFYYANSAMTDGTTFSIGFSIDLQNIEFK